MPTKNCVQCGVEYSIPNYRVSNSRFCGKPCHGRWTSAHRVYDGSHAIGNKYRLGLPGPYKGQVGPTKGRRFVDYVKYTCAYCDKEFERSPNESRKHPGGDKMGRFCNRACSNKFISERRSGVQSPLYVGGIKTYRGRGWNEARMLAVLRDGGSCVVCFRHIGASIPVHHIRPFREFADPKEANVLGNLTCMCQSCHMKAEWAHLKGQV